MSSEQFQTEVSDLRNAETKHSRTVQMHWNPTSTPIGVPMQFWWGTVSVIPQRLDFIAATSQWLLHGRSRVIMQVEPVSIIKNQEKQTKGRSCWRKPDTCGPQTATVEDLQCYEQPTSADFLNTLNNVFLWQLSSTYLNNWHRLGSFRRHHRWQTLSQTGAEQKSSRALLLSWAGKN